MTTLVKEKQIYMPVQQQTETDLVLAKEKILRLHKNIKRLDVKMAKEKRLYHYLCNEIASDLVRGRIFERSPNCLDYQRGIDWFINELDKEIVTRQQGWLPFAHKVYGGHGYCGYFILDYEQPWYLGGVDKNILVERPIALRREGSFKVQMKGQYSTYTPFVYESVPILSKLKTDMPKQVQELYNYAIGTNMFESILVASPNPDIFKTRTIPKPKRKDPILIGEKWRRWDERDNGEYAMEWLVIGAWDIASDLDTVFGKAIKGNA